MNADKPDKWFSVSVTVAPEYVEAAESAFNNLDSLGSEVDTFAPEYEDLLTVTAYFTSPPDARILASELRSAARLFELPEDIDFVIRHSVVEDQDWLAEWKKYWKPVRIGRFVIAAPWHQVDISPEVSVIRIDPNMAFGTGTHETTQLCLEALDKYFVPGMSFLDVGTGTGILAIAAAMIGESSHAPVIAVDTDADAIAIARKNAEMNGVDISFEAGSIEKAPGRFDLVCANLTADVIIPLLPELLARTGSILILSGILHEQEDSVLRAFPSGLDVDISRSGEWIAIVAKANLS